MTLPNRSNYIPGDKKRERKYEEPHEAISFKTEAVERAELSPHHYDEALREELLQVLSGIVPEGSNGHGTPTSSLEHPMIKLARSKEQAENAYQRLQVDECYQQLPVKEEVMSFTAMMDPGFTPLTAEADPLEHIVSNMAADTGLQPQHSTSTVTHQVKTPYRLDPQWATLFEHAGPARQQLINGLDRLEQASGTSELDSAMEMIQDAPMRGKYQRSSSNLHEWSKQRLYQQLRATMLGRGASIGRRSTPPSPIDSPFNQPPKKRANLSKHAKQVLSDWFHDHLHHPYPTEEEKERLSQHGGITIEQVNNWFINTRGRKWKPMMRRILDEREAGLPSATFDRLVAKIEQPFGN